jgi:hypothetical protein
MGTKTYIGTVHINTASGEIQLTMTPYATTNPYFLVKGTFSDAKIRDVVLAFHGEESPNVEESSSKTSNYVETPKEKSPPTKNVAKVRDMNSVSELAISADSKVRFVQEKLTNLGYSPGSVDGVMGSKTRNAIKEFQDNSGEKATGEVTDKLVEELSAPCTTKIIDWVAHQHGACPKPKELAPGVEMHSSSFGGNYISKPSR